MSGEELVDCPDPGCDGVLIRMSMPSEKPVKYRCMSCGLITWVGPEVWSHTGVPMDTLAVSITLQGVT